MSFLTVAVARLTVPIFVALICATAQAETDITEEMLHALDVPPGAKSISVPGVSTGSKTIIPISPNADWVGESSTGSEGNQAGTCENTSWFSSHTVYFDTDSTELSSDKSAATLSVLLDYFSNASATDRANPLIIVGHTDTTGTQIYNLSLSKKRALAVVEYLLRSGIGERELVSLGAGESNLHVQTGDETSEPLNRRVEFMKCHDGSNQ